MLAWGEQLLASVQKGIESCESNFQISPIVIQRFQPINVSFITPKGQSVSCLQTLRLAQIH